MPRGRVILPRIVGFELHGFEPIFETDIQMSLRTGPNIVLGGNGLGKTTIMQAIVYGLTGGASDEIEDDKNLRWDHRYFRRRLNATQAGEAFVQVEFALGKHRFTIAREFNTARIARFRSGARQGWIKNTDKAESAFATALSAYGGYKHAEDFAFVIHRLLYLPESRRLLAWDTNAQLRILMLLNQDTAREREFRKARAALKMMDTQKRHIHVALGKAIQQLETLFEYEEPSSEETEDTEPHVDKTDLSEDLDKLRVVAKERTAIDVDRSAALNKLTNVATEAEQLQNQIDNSEAALIERFLSEAERENSLALHKLLENAICPACGTRDVEIQRQAQAYMHNHSCALCGSPLPHTENPELGTLRHRLAEKLSTQKSLEKSVRDLENRRDQLRVIEIQLQTKINEIRFKQPVVTLLERGLPTESKDDLLALKSRLEQQEADLGAQIIERKAELESEYQQFLTAASQRVEKLRQIYESYATAFLGVPCHLSAVAGDDRFIALTKFVPEFNGLSREEPESCSEAQRFFLDIAFRMALIDVSSELSKTPSSFICETPETALDMSYIENVVDMFDQFAEKRHSVLMTANIQTDGIAKKLLQSVPRSERRNRVLNLLDFGRLSDVQQRALKRLQKAAQNTVK